jgi:DNA-binding PadR family transcriptional regulator
VHISTLIFFLPDTREIKISELIKKVERINDEAAATLNVPKTKESIYTSVQRLEKQGMVKSRFDVVTMHLPNGDPHPRREKIIKLTDRGRILVQNMRAVVYSGSVSEKIDGFTDEMSGVMKKLFDIYSKRLFK